MPMDEVTLPHPLDDFVAAVNRHDEAAFLLLFPPDGTVDDWGQRMEGRAAIQRWSAEQFIGAKGVITPRSFTRRGNIVHVKADWKSSFYSGESEFIFTLENGFIREMRIPPH